MQLLDDGTEATARQVEEVEAFSQSDRLLVFVALVYGVVPDLPLNDRPQFYEMSACSIPYQLDEY